MPCTTTQLTTLVLHEETKTWAAARLVCNADGGKLMSIESLEKRVDLLFMDSLPSWNNRVMTADLWFGLHTDTGASCSTVEYEWDDGEPLGSWSDWYSGSYTEPNSCTTDRCVRIAASTWKTIGCGSMYGFVCEYVGGTCVFETLTDTQFINGPGSIAFPDATNVFVEMDATTPNVASCLDACMTSTISDLDCWFVLANDSSPNICYMYYTTDKYLADDTNQITAIAGSTIYIKRCGVPAVNGETTTVTPTVTTTTTCTVLTTSSPTTTSTTEAVTPTTTATTTTTQPATTTTAQPATTTGPTTTATDNSQSNVMCVKYNNQTKYYTDEELTELVENLKKELTVEKNSTNRYLRTLISVYDGRTSAVSIGVTGSIFLGIIPFLIVLADARMMLKHIRGDWIDSNEEEGSEE